MTKPKAKPEKSRQTDPALILFAHEGGKPRAGTFAERDAEAATKAARSLGLAVLKVSGAQAQDLASKLSAGQIHANGRGLVPFIRGDLMVAIGGLSRSTRKSKAAGAWTAHNSTKRWPRLASTAFRS